MNELIAAIVRSRPASAALLLILCGSIYANAVGNAFQYDDRHAIVENDHIRSLGNIPSFLTHPEYFSRDADKAMYRPLFLTSMALNYAWSGADTASYHLVSILLHALTSILVWLLFLELRLSACLALLGAALFAAHPLATEPVNYVSSRSELMVALFVLASLWLYLRSDPRQALPRRRALVFLRAGSIACFAAALGSKEVGIMLLPLLVLVDRLGERGWRSQVATYAPYGVLAGIYLLYIRSFVGTALAGDPVRSMSQQLGTQLKALPYYAKLIVMPTGLTVHHSFAESSVAEADALLALLSIASLAAVTAGWARGRGRGRRGGGRLVGFGLVWIVVVLLPTLVVPLNVLVNEHRLYLALVGALLAVLGLERIEAFRGMLWGGPVLVLLLAVHVVRQNPVWADEGTLWSNALRRAPTAVEPYVYLGNHARVQDRPRRAVELFEAALELEPDNLSARNNLANAHRELGQWEQAISLYEDILKEHPEQSDVHYNAARAYQDAGDLASARRHYLAVDSTSHHVDLALNNLGTLWEEDGRPDSAAAYYRAALSHEPTSVDAGRNLRRLERALPGLAPKLNAHGEHAITIELCRQLLSLDPQGRQALWYLATSLFEYARTQTDRAVAARAYAQSLAANRQLVRHHPRHWYGQLQLANALETTNAPGEALQVYELLISGCDDAGIRQQAVSRHRSLKARSAP